MRFPYLELAAKVEKFVERKPVEKAVVKLAAVAVAAKSEPVMVAEPEPVVQVAPPKNPPVAMVEQLKPPAQVNEQQQHFFE